MINVIQRALSSSQINQILDRRDKVFVGQNAFCGIDVDSQFLINLVAANTAEAVFFWIEKEPF